jgi:hypothetical protein
MGQYRGGLFAGSNGFPYGAATNCRATSST